MSLEEIINNAIDAWEYMPVQSDASLQGVIAAALRVALASDPALATELGAEQVGWTNPHVGLHVLQVGDLARPHEWACYQTDRPVYAWGSTTPAESEKP